VRRASRPHAAALALLILSVVASIGGAGGEESAQAAARPSADLYVSPSGRDGGRCSRTRPCRTWGRAYRVARNGATISVAGGSYGQTTLSGSKRVTFEVVAGQQANVSPQLLIKNANHLTVRGHVHTSGDPMVDFRFDGCNSDVTIAGASGNVIAWLGTDRDITIRRVSFGGYSQAGKGDDSGISPHAGRGAKCLISDDGIARNITIERSRFHDVLYVPESGWGGAHPDCFELEGRVDGITFRGNVFERCGNTFVGGYTDFGHLLNVTFENNVFRSIGPSTWWSMQFGSNGDYRCEGLVFRFNTYDPNNPDAFEPHAPPLLTCPGAQVYGNIFRKGPGRDGDDGRACQANGQVWSHNVFETAGTACGSHVTIARDALFVDRGSDYRLRPGAAALGKGPPDRFPPRDFDGRRRSSPPDAGAFERS
jgi:hypothetical protein